MVKQVVRCSVCARVHGVTELLNREQLVNGTSTFVCPIKKTAGTYKLEEIGTLRTPDFVST
jgi:hypothetical protein